MFGASATIVAGRLLAAVANLALVAWLTQALSQADLGRYAVIVTLANVGSIFSDVGQRLYLTRQLPLVAQAGPLVRRSLLAVVVVATGLGGLWLALGTPIDGFARTAVGAAMMALLGLQIALSGALTGTGRVVWAGLALQAFRPLTGLVALGAVAAVSTLDLDRALLAQLGALIVVVALTAAGMLTRRTPPTAVAKPSAPWVATSLPLMVMGGLGVLSGHIDILVVRSLDSADGAGVYFNAAALALVPAYALSAANAVIMPRVSRAWAEGRIDDVHAVLGRSLRFALAGAIPASAGVMVAYAWGVDLGWAFAEGIPILGVLVAGQLVNVASGSVGITLLMCGYERLVALSYAASLTLNVVVSVALVPVLGPLGAAAGTALALSAWNLWLVANLRARLGVDTSVLRAVFGRPALSGRPPTPSS